MIGCDVSWKCAVACLFGELSQQPMCPQVEHMRRCTHHPSICRHSSQPAISAGSAVTLISSRCVQLTQISMATGGRLATGDTRLPHEPSASGHERGAVGYRVDDAFLYAANCH